MFDVIVDTREQTPWTFASSTVIDNIVHRKLDTGDYSVVGFEDVLCIERKKSVAEIATNITEDRFKRAMERMAQFKYKFLLLEFSYYQIDQYPEGSNIPKWKQSKTVVTGAFIMRRLVEIQVQHDIHVIACGNAQYAEYMAEKIMKRVYESRNS
jgi:ERCC4-type nuclease